MTKLGALFDQVVTHRRWVIHVLFWLLILAFYVIFFGRKSENYFLTLFFVGMPMPITIATTYFLNYVLVPRYLLQERYFLFGLYSIYTLIASLFLETTISLITFIVMAEVRIKDMSPASIDLILLLTSLLMVVFFGVAIKMVRHWQKSKDDYQKLMLEKVETELKFLKTQLHPHFLFNTLNNLYYLAVVKSDKAPQAILALSEMLDYVLKEGKSMVVPVSKELNHVNNYIALEMLRYEEKVHVDLVVNGDPEKHTIGPMILITLMENAFKHGVMPVAGKSWVKMNVMCTDECIQIEIHNSRTHTKNGHGIGLANLQSQLKHLYGGNCDFTIVDDNPQAFQVKLVIKTK